VGGAGVGLDGKVAVVTGGGVGIGGAVVDALADAGARVTFVEVDDRRAAARLEAARSRGGEVDAVVGDITRDETVAAVAATVERCDILVNNVGHHLRSTPFLRSGPDRWDALDAVNVRHVLACCRALVPGMVERGSGAVVNVSSVEGLRAFPPDPVYAAAKAAVIHFTRSFAMEVAAAGVRVNAVAPDVTQTPQVDYASWVGPEDAHRWSTWVPMGRVGTPDETAAAVVFLASDLARFVTGQVLATDGGTLTAGGWFRTAEGRWTNRPRDP
jgi:NAD(P)-dependent dehydrogenase (short-subunit alcohol dehydrogenase family)